MDWTDAAGLAGVLMRWGAYGAATLGRLDPKSLPALLANFVGACLVLLSLLIGHFNLAATVMETAWGLVALVGLINLARKRWG